MFNEHLRIALLTHSTNPRGGVVHAMELGDALHELGQSVVLHAPDPQRRGLFRKTQCAFAAVPGQAPEAGLANLVRRRIADYISWFERPDAPAYDVYHAQDTISANALATLAERGVIPGFIRTVHHLDQFDDPQFTAWQNRGFERADRVLCVSRLWRDQLMAQYGVAAEVVANGVDTRRYQPRATPADAALRSRIGLGEGPCFLAVGGIEPRKNTLGVLRAFIRILRAYPQAQLVIAGGASLLDHSAYRLEFERAASDAGLRIGRQLTILGQVDDDDMPALFRCADALVFPSLKEGFGLVVLEAMASGTPAVVSRIAPFTEYLQGDSCAWVDPEDPASIAAGMAHACDPIARASLRAAGREVCRRFSWPQAAALHLDIYRAQAAHSLEISHA
jgi:glycosyltransferase-like protein